MATSGFLPANETSLGLGKWGNTSLFGLGSRQFVQYPTNLDHNQNVNLTVYPNNIASVTFNSTNPYVSFAFPLAQVLFDSDAIRVPVACIWPFSGQYDVLNRVLFYILMVFALLFRRHSWLSYAALGTAMTYAATTAVHTLALVSNFSADKLPGEFDVNSSQSFFDPDLLASYPILTVAAIMLTPILMWSSSLRYREENGVKVKQYGAQAIVILWGMLIFIALTASMYKTYVLPGGVNSINSYASCSSNSTYCLSEVPKEVIFMSRSYYDECNCMDFCSTLGPPAPMRFSGNMVAWLYKGKPIATKTLQGLGDFGIIALIFIILNGTLGIIEVRFTQAEARHLIFVILNGDKGFWIKTFFKGEEEQEDMLNQWDDKHPQPKRGNLRYIFAWSVAAWFFLIALVLSVVSPALFIIAVVAFEISLESYPYSEYSDAVGAWGTWVGAALVIMAALIDKYQQDWVEFTLIVFGRMRLHTKKSDKKVLDIVGNFFKAVVSPLVHFYCSGFKTTWTAKRTLRGFQIWWQDPVRISRLDQDELDALVVSRHGNLREPPECGCKLCVDDEENPADGEDRKKVTREIEQGIRNLIIRNLGGDVVMKITLPQHNPNAGSTTGNTSINSGPEDTLLDHVDKMSSVKDADVVVTTTVAQDPSLVPLPASRNTFPRQNTNQDISRGS